jgi:8-oxo-dGTP pyrophosphatase MutT (NUDIX family)
MSKIQNYLKTKPSLIKSVVCYLVNNDRVLLGLRKKVSLGLGENLITGIGGKVGDKPEFANETDDDALKREVQEEIGVEVKSYRDMGKVTFLFPNKPTWSQEVIIYLVDEWKGEPVESESIKPMWFDQSKLPAKQMWEDNPIWIPMVLEGKRINATFLYAENNKSILEQEIKILE